VALAQLVRGPTADSERYAGLPEISPICR